MKFSERYPPPALANVYVEVIQELHQYFKGVVGHKWSPGILLQLLLRAKFTYASPAAYQRINIVTRKEKEDDQEINNPVALYNGNSEIIVSLPEDDTLENIKKYSIHESGHYLHHVSAPESYIDCDETMKETLAILLEEEGGINSSFISNTPHGRANELLRKAYETKFRGNTFAEEWKILTEFRKHQDFEDYLDGKLKLYGKN